MDQPIFKQIFGSFFLFFLAVFSLSAQSPLTGSICLAQTDGKGTVNLLWFPAGGEWPLGGWQVQNSDGKVLIPRIMVGEGEFLSGLDPKTAQGVLQYAKGLPVFKDGEEKKNFFFGLRVATLTNYALSRALGFSRSLDHVASGPRVYRIQGLDAAGKPTGVVLKSPAIDSTVSTPLPSAPGGFRAEASPDGVRLFWSPGPGQPLAPVTHYLVERPGASGQTEVKTSSPILLNEAAAPDRQRYIDASAAVEQEISYSLCGVDAFGRRSQAVECKVFHGDFAALIAPADIKADGLKGKVVLSWTPNSSPNTSRVFIERAFKDNGNYIVITPKGLPHEMNSYEDTTVPGGVTAFYRLRSLGPRQNLGEPSLPVSARPLNLTPPAAPKSLKAEIGRTRVRLTWEASSTPIIAYILERRTGKNDWSRINPQLDQQAQYDDPLGEASGGGTVFYRVKAVAFDNQEGEYSKAIEVVLPERGLPPVPRITAVESKDGKAIVHFKPGWPEAKTSQFLVLRSGSPDVWGVVLGRPLSATTCTYVDPIVAAGESYWYRVIAVNSRNDRSDPSAAVVVTVGTPPIPTPAAPRLEIIKEPFPQVKIIFSAPPTGQGLVVVCERKLDGDELWIRLPGTTSGNELQDSNPPVMGKLFYRVIYLAPNGAAGEPSPSIDLMR